MALLKTGLPTFCPRLPTKQKQYFELDWRSDAGNEFARQASLVAGHCGGKPSEIIAKKASVKYMKVTVNAIPNPEVKIYVLPSPSVTVYSLCNMSNVPLSGQVFERDEDPGAQIFVTAKSRTQDILGDTVVVVDLYDATTSPETYIMTKDNGDAASPEYEGGAIVKTYTSDRLEAHVVWDHSTDLGTLPDGQRTLRYKVYIIHDGRRHHANTGQFTIKAA